MQINPKNDFICNTDYIWTLQCTIFHLKNAQIYSQKFLSEFSKKKFQNMFFSENFINLIK